MKRALKYVLGILAGTMAFGMSAFAAEVTVTPVDLVLYSNETAVLYEEPDLTSTVVLDAASFPDDLAIQVTGITSTGFYEVNVGGTYYVPEAGLTDDGSSETAESTETDDTLVLDLGYGVTFISPTSIASYTSKGVYEGTFGIIGAKIISHSTTVGDRVSIKYTPLEYGTSGRNKIYVYAVCLDSDGYEIYSYLIGASTATDAIGEVLTYTFYAYPSTAVIVIQDD